MTRHHFLSFAALVALGVGTFATLAPAALLASKGVSPSPAAEVWVREVGINIFALGVMSALMRRHPDSPTMRAFLLGNAVIQMGLFPIELLAFDRGVITLASGIAPNSVLHVVLALGFLWFARQVRPTTQSAGSFSASSS